MSRRQDWKFIPIKRVDRVAQPAGDIARTAVVTDDAGVRYGGFPVAPLDGTTGLLMPVADLPSRPITGTGTGTDG
jgi:hypothetical protein